MIDDNYQARIEVLKKVSALDLPAKILEFELTDGQSAFEIFDKLSAQFAKEDFLENVVEPTFCAMIDGILDMSCFKGVTRKLGLTAQRVLKECKSFSYDGRMSYLMPDTQTEARNYVHQAEAWKNEHRSTYDRKKYENVPAMNRYKERRIQENGGRVNMEDEYRMTRDISASRAGADKRRNDPKFNYVAETDHIIPLKKVFDQVQSNSALSDDDIFRIANRDSNFAVTGRLVNNPKRQMSNSEFIARQETLKAEGKPYVELSEEQKRNMIRMEMEAQDALNKSINKMVLDNLSGRGPSNKKAFQDAIKKERARLGRELTPDESNAVRQRCALEKARGIYMDAGKRAVGQGLLYAMGNLMLLIMKPLYFELKDGFFNGFIAGVYAGSAKEAFAVRFARVGDYVLEQLKSIEFYLGNFIEFVKTLVSTLIEILLNMFVGLCKQLLRVVKEGVKIVMQSFSILFGQQSKNMSLSEKGDAILHIVGGSIVTLCGIAIDTLGLKKIPEGFRTPIKTILTGLAGVLVFYAIDKADLFNVVEERRNMRLQEVFDLRSRDVEERAAALTEAAADSLRSTSIAQARVFGAIGSAIENREYARLSCELSELSQLLLGRTIEPYKPGMKWNS